jgi:hypothetical protein
MEDCLYRPFAYGRDIHDMVHESCRSSTTTSNLPPCMSSLPPYISVPFICLHVLAAASSHIWWQVALENKQLLLHCCCSHDDVMTGVQQVILSMRWC